MVVFISFSLFAYSVQAEGKKIIKTADFTSESVNPNYSGFNSQIEEGGTRYSLGDITYKKISEEKKTVLEDKTTTINKTGLNSQRYRIGTTENITVGGKDYVGTVTNVNYTDVTIRNRTGEVRGSQDYGLSTSKPNVPQSKSLPYYDNETGQSYNVDAPLQRMEKTESKWQDYTHIDIVVSNYTDTQFMFNNKIIKHNGTTVMDSSHYPELMSMAGLHGNNYKISSVNWVGSSYKDRNVRYRNARANIQAYSASYKAFYYKKFNLADVPRYNATVTFKYSQENVLKTIYTYKATATYIPVDTETESTSVQGTTKAVQPTAEAKPPNVPITVKTVTTISVILVISLAFVLVGFFLLTKIKSKDNLLSKVLNRKRRR